MAPTKSIQVKSVTGFQKKGGKFPINGKLVSTQTKAYFYSKNIWGLLKRLNFNEKKIDIENKICKH